MRRIVYVAVEGAVNPSSPAGKRDPVPCREMIFLHRIPHAQPCSALRDHILSDLNSDVQIQSVRILLPTVLQRSSVQRDHRAPLQDFEAVFFRQDRIEPILVRMTNRPQNRIRLLKPHQSLCVQAQAVIRFIGIHQKTAILETVGLPVILDPDGISLLTVFRRVQKFCVLRIDLFFLTQQPVRRLLRLFLRKQSGFRILRGSVSRRGIRVFHDERILHGLCVFLHSLCVFQGERILHGFCIFFHCLCIFYGKHILHGLCVFHDECVFRGGCILRDNGILHSERILLSKRILYSTCIFHSECILHGFHRKLLFHCIRKKTCIQKQFLTCLTHRFFSQEDSLLHRSRRSCLCKKHNRSQKHRKSPSFHLIPPHKQCFYVSLFVVTVYPKNTILKE